MITFVDIFCGAGGSSTGLVAAGMELRLAANHWQRAIETHAANHPTADHLCADVNNYDMRRLPKADVLWASPICTEISPAGGRKRTRGQLELLEHGSVPDAAWERTRATAYDVLRYVEVHRPRVVMWENVPEFVTDWELFDWWWGGFDLLGYEGKVVSASSAHLSGVDNDAAAQWRNRAYGVLVRKGTPMPDLEVRPEAVCPGCGPVQARQVWRNPARRRAGKWGVQYDYRCPNRQCGHLILDPIVRPVADIIDWSLPGRRIGDGRPDRKVFTPYAASTRARVEAGLAAYGTDPHVAVLRRNGTAVPVTGPIPGLSAQGRHHALVVPNGRKGAVRTTAEPVTTIATKPHHSLVRPAATVDDCTLRMLTPRELMSAQRFGTDYVVHGNQAEQIMQAGNAVSVNAAQWLGARVLAALA
ncbi:DNA cytosine methyltransferase [Streptomyces sp. NPDC058757]|uniref:DNA cytosine methyltransferase n=1 Tax=Streptomyces sp. NPDC058757 TaxID=3346626 RepID=UPI0036A89195